MALQSLAPYYGRREDVTEVVDRALTWLSSAQRPDGNYSTDDFGMGTGPVSYTHLDVYKRQAEYGKCSESW